MNAKTVCHEQTVMTRVASNIQSSSPQNSGSRWLVLKPLMNANKCYLRKINHLFPQDIATIKCVISKLHFRIFFCYSPPFYALHQHVIHSAHFKSECTGLFYYGNRKEWVDELTVHESFVTGI